jgi:serine/threonine protein kinase
MIDKRGHIKLTDFGLSELQVVRKHNESEENKVFGTLDYLSPELTLGLPHDKSVDFWALGVLIFELLTGIKPFNENNPETIIENIQKKKISWPRVVPKQDIQLHKGEVCISEEAFNLIDQLLAVDPSTRLGSNSIEDIKSHKFFRGKLFIIIDINWINIRKHKPLFVPKNASRNSALYFDKTRLKTPNSLKVDEENKNNEAFFSNQREEFLHGINLESIQEVIKLKYIESGSLYGLENMLKDMKDDNNNL